jgi:large subunit ribosomal protein L4
MQSIDRITTLETKKAIGLIHKVYLCDLKNSRKYNASTKTKSEVSGGGRKPWRQKGTGNARAGSIRSPLWRGGGVAFGPKPRLVFKKVNKKEKRLAILAALYIKDKKIKVLKNSVLSDSINSKTKSFINFIKNININPNERILIILPKMLQELKLATQNKENVELTLANCLNIKEILNSTSILLSEEALSIINSTYGNS